MIDMRSRTVLAAAAVGVALVAWLLGPSTRDNHVKADTERPPAMQAAIAAWEDGNLRVTASGLRVSKGKKRIINIGYVSSTPSCSPTSCISSSTAKKIPLSHFTVDPSLNTAELRFGSWGSRFELTWEGSGEPRADAGERGTRMKRRGRAAGRVRAADVQEPIRARGVLKQVARASYPAEPESSASPASYPGAAASDLSIGSSSSSCWTSKASEKAMKRLITRARRSRDLGAVRLDPELSRVARKHTADMIDGGGLFHQPAEQLATRVTRWLKLGENVGAGDSIRELHSAFMKSTTHRANILKPAFRHIGVGVSNHAGEKWITVVFESRQDPGTTLSMPSC